MKIYCFFSFSSSNVSEKKALFSGGGASLFKSEDKDKVAKASSSEDKVAKKPAVPEALFANNKVFHGSPEKSAAKIVSDISNNTDKKLADFSNNSHQNGSVQRC